MSNIRELMRQERLRRLSEKPNSTQPNQTSRSTQSHDTHNLTKMKPIELSGPPNTKILPPDFSTSNSLPDSSASILHSSTSEFEWAIPDPIKHVNKNQISSTNSIPFNNSELDTNSDSNKIVNQQSYSIKHTITPSTSLVISSDPSPNTQLYPSNLNPKNNLQDEMLPDDFFDKFPNTPQNGEFDVIQSPEIQDTDIDTIQNPEIQDTNQKFESYDDQWEYEWIEPDISLLENNHETLLQTPLEDENQSKTLSTKQSDIIENNELSEIPTGEIDEISELSLYQALDTVYHSNLEDEEKGPQSQDSTTNIPEGFFDDKDADAKARGLEGPKKRKLKELDKEFKNFSTLMDVQMIKVDLSQEISDSQRFEVNQQEDLSKQAQLEQMLVELRKKKSAKKFVKHQTKPIISTSIKAFDYEDEYEFDDMNTWRSKTLI